MKRRTVTSSNSKKMSRLGFKEQEQVAIAARDYGLMRTSNKAQTPYPHVDPGVDANLLKARLSMRRHFEIKQSEGSQFSRDRMDSSHTIKTNRSGMTASLKSVHIGNQLPDSSNVKSLLSTGTPHPVKSVALNAKVLSTRLTDLNMQIGEHASSPVPEEAPVTRIKKVRLVNVPKIILIQPETTLDSERLSDISLRVTRLDYIVASNLSLGADPSFAERRRQFDEGEFTIAKKGRKMSDMMMAYTTLEKRLTDNTTQFAKKAKEEIERYIKAQGLIKTSNDQLKWTRHFDLSSPGSSSDSWPDH